METGHGTWGNRTRIYQDSSCLVTYLDLEPNNHCSWHVHRTAFNQFYVIAGMIGVKTDKGYVTKLSPGHSFTTEPGIYHEFITYDIGAKVIEIAYVKYDEHDIDRAELGGKNE